MKKKFFLIFSLLFIYIFTSYNSCSDEPDPSSLPPNKNLPIEVLFQQRNMWCGQACIEMWAWYEGHYDVSQEEISQDGRFCDCYPECGMWFYQIVGAVNSYAAEAVGDVSYDDSRLSCEYLLGIFTDALRDAEPTILIYFDRFYRGKHANIIKGYTKNEEDNNDQLIPEIKTISSNDPARGEENWTYSEFIDYKMNPVSCYLSEDDKFWDFRTSGIFYVVGTYKKSYSDRKAIAAQGYQGFLERCGTYYGGPQIYIPEGSTFVRVRYPQGNETLAHGKSEQIKWEANGLSGQIKLELYKNDILKGTIAQNLPIGNGSYNWTAGQYQGGSVQTGENYRIKVAMMDNSYDDFSNVYFNLGSVTVNSPNGGETWEQGSLRYITWNSSYFTGDVQLWLRKTIPGTDYLIADKIENTGLYEWTVGQCTDVEENRGMIIPGDNCYKIKVVSYDNTNLMDSSNDVFSIAAPQPSITVISPNGGEGWDAGSVQNITWTTTGTVGLLKITLWQNDAWLGVIADNISPGAGSYSWTAGQHTTGSALPGLGYRIKIKEIDTSLSDSSDNVFSLDGITVTAPNGGESWQLGSSQTITWNAVGLTGLVKITLYKDGAWLGMIADNLDPAQGSYTWTAGQHSAGTAAAGSGYTIKIKEKDTTLADTSDLSFSLNN